MAPEVRPEPAGLFVGSGSWPRSRTRGAKQSPRRVGKLTGARRVVWLGNIITYPAPSCKVPVMYMLRERVSVSQYAIRPDPGLDAHPSCVALPGPTDGRGYAMTVAPATSAPR